ncbi:hypothetical protein P4S57_20990 [Pseudoalteromonas sp. Hal273]
MNLEALDELNTNNPELLEQSARDNGLDPEAVKGIALFAVGNGYEALSSNQKYNFDNGIRALIENVQCEGYSHECDEMPGSCSATLDDDDLVECYQNQEFYCEYCQAQSSADAHSKASFFKD